MGTHLKKSSSVPEKVPAVKTHFLFLFIIHRSLSGITFSFFCPPLISLYLLSLLSLKSMQPSPFSLMPSASPENFHDITWPTDLEFGGRMLSVTEKQNPSPESTLPLMGHRGAKYDGVCI